jgi:predicted acetyltransferase
MLSERSTKWFRVFNAPPDRVVVYAEQDVVRGYMVYAFKKAQENNWIKNDIILHDFFYETPAALHGLLTFLHTQADQIHRIVLATQDDTFHHILRDPRNGTDTILVLLAHETNIEGVGIMYRVINTTQLFKSIKNHCFSDQTCVVKLTVADDFLPENNGSIVIHFHKGRPELTTIKKAEVEISMNIADFSSLIMGVIDLHTLCGYGLADVSKPRYRDTLAQVFFSRVKPVTTTQF